jgi:hypothetical protein
MDPETKKLLNESLEVEKDNNEMLKKIVRNQRLTNIYRVVYWGIIIFSSVGAYYFIQPYLSSVVNLYTGGVSNIGNISDITSKLSDKQQIEDLLKVFQQ